MIAHVVPEKVNQGLQTGSAATTPPPHSDSIRSEKPMADISRIRPGRRYRPYRPISMAIGRVANIVKLPQGEPASALTTTSASTASRMTMMASTPTLATTPANGPISVRIMSPSERPSRRTEKNRIRKSCTAPATTTPTRIQSVAGR